MADEVITAPSAGTEGEESPTTAPLHDPIREERERIESSGEKKLTKRERLLFAKGKIEEQLKEFGGDVVEGIDPTTPVTVGMLEEMRKGEAKKTAIDLAQTIENEDERIVVVDYLENRIVPSGNPEADLKLARAAVNSLRNEQLLSETQRGGTAKTHSSGSGAPSVQTSNEELTPTEMVFTQPPYNLTKAEIVSKRPKA
jgi:hypothetical protein